MIQTDQITKTYQNGYKAVNGLSLRVSKGDIFGFLGPNGAGKTTTIRMLDGLLTPTHGTIIIDGKNIAKNPVEVKKIIGVVPESHGYYYWMTAKEYLQYFNSLFNGKESNDKYINYLLQKVGLADKADVTIGQFSRGMKQRVGIAKSLINKPKIIFLDEPTLGLDPRGQREIQQLLQDINQNDRITIFITSHLLKDIEVLCNKVCILKKGVLVEQGSIPELQKKYMKNYSVKIRTNDNKKVLAVLDNARNIESIIHEDDYITLKFKTDLDKQEIEVIKHSIFVSLFKENIEIEEIISSKLSMEDIFFKATEKEN